MRIWFRSKAHRAVDDEDEVHSTDVLEASFNKFLHQLETIDPDVAASYLRGRTSRQGVERGLASEDPGHALLDAFDDLKHALHLIDHDIAVHKMRQCLSSLGWSADRRRTALQAVSQMNVLS